MSELIFPIDTADAKRLSRRVSRGELHRIRQGIYTDADWGDIPKLLKNRWYEVVSYLYPSAIVSHATACLLQPAHDVVHITADVKIRKKVVVSEGLTIEVHPGNVTELIELFNPPLYRSSPARYLLENLQITHKDINAPKALGKQWVESELCKLLECNGEAELNRVRDSAREHHSTLGLHKEFKLLDKMIGALLSTHTYDVLSLPLAIAHAKKSPFDARRLDLFKDFARYLFNCGIKSQVYSFNKSAWRNLSFFESYFSNYIEGTEFEIDEAEQIIFEQREIENRHQDSHDVLSVFDVVSDYTEMCSTPNSADDFISLLTSRHSFIMRSRPEKRPGEFKEKINKAGDTIFVLPENIHGTLEQGFSVYETLPEGFLRAIFMQFLVAECHPFDDGNGRLSRIMMNAELVATEQHKIIVPTVHRDSYLNGLRQATRNGRFRVITKVFADLQSYTSAIPWEDYGEARDTLESHFADKLPDTGVAVFNKQISKYRHILPAG